MWFGALRRIRSPEWRDAVPSTFPHDSGTVPAMQADFVPLFGKVPECYCLSTMSDSDKPWHPRRIAERINAQVERLGMSRTALLKEADVPEKAVRDLEAEHWPNLRKIVQLAKAFKFPGGVGELLGLSPPEDNRCDPRLLHVALELTAAVMDSSRGEDPLRSAPHIVAALAAVAHQQLVELRRIDPNALDNSAALHMISVMLRSELARFERPNS